MILGRNIGNYLQTITICHWNTEPKCFLFNCIFKVLVSHFGHIRESQKMLVSNTHIHVFPFYHLIRRQMRRVMRNPAFLHMRKQRRRSLFSLHNYIDNTIPLISKPNAQASSHLLWQYSLVCVRNPEDSFSRDAAQIIN